LGSFVRILQKTQGGIHVTQLGPLHRGNFLLQTHLPLLELTLWVVRLGHKGLGTGRDQGLCGTQVWHLTCLAFGFEIRIFWKRKSETRAVSWDPFVMLR